MNFGRDGKHPFEQNNNALVPDSFCPHKDTFDTIEYSTDDTNRRPFSDIDLLWTEISQILFRP